MEDGSILSIFLLVRYYTFLFFVFRELREMIRPEVMELIRKQRLHHLVQGTQFNKYSRGGIVKGKNDNKYTINASTCEQDSFNNTINLVIFSEIKRYLDYC